MLQLSFTELYIFNVCIPKWLKINNLHGKIELYVTGAPLRIFQKTHFNPFHHLIYY